MNIKSKVMDWFGDLPERDKWILVGGTLAAIIFLIYTLLWSPLINKTTLLEKSVADQSETFHWMQSRVKEIEALRLQSKKAIIKSRGSQSLIGLVDETARSNKLGDSIQRIQPSHNDGVQVWLKAAIFDNVLNWLVELEEYGVVVNTIKLRGLNEPGLVTVEVILKEVEVSDR